MKIAIPTNSGKIDDHYGHCEYFLVYTTNEQKDIIYEEMIASPNGCGCQSDIDKKLSQIGVKIMLAGNIGSGAVNKLNNSGITVVRGCSGDIKNVLSEWLNGNIKDNGQLCIEHEHHHEHEHNHQHKHKHGDNCN